MGATQVRESGEIVEVWLRRGERDDPDVQARLRALCAQCAGSRLVAVFLSGEAELAGQTSALLCGHFRRGAQGGP